MRLMLISLASNDPFPTTFAPDTRLGGLFCRSMQAESGSVSPYQDTWAFVNGAQGTRGEKGDLMLWARLLFAWIKFGTTRMSTVVLRLMSFVCALTAFSPFRPCKRSLATPAFLSLFLQAALNPTPSPAWVTQLPLISRERDILTCGHLHFRIQLPYFAETN